FWSGLHQARSYNSDAPRLAGVPLHLPPQSAYVAPSLKSSRSAQRSIFGLTYCPTRPFMLLPVRIKGLTADIFHARQDQKRLPAGSPSCGARAANQRERRREPSRQPPSARPAKASDAGSGSGLASGTSVAVSLPVLSGGMSGFSV